MIQWRKIISFDFHHIPKLSIGFNIFVELEHFIFFNNFDKYHNLIYYRINIKLNGS